MNKMTNKEKTEWIKDPLNKSKVERYTKNYLNHIEAEEDPIMKIVLAMDLYELLIFWQTERETIMNLFIEHEVYKSIDFNLLGNKNIMDHKREHRVEIKDFLLNLKSEVRDLKIIDILK